MSNEENLSEENKDATQSGLLEEKIKQLEEEKADLEDKYLRKHADFENYRKRMVKEKSEAILYANADIVKELLDVLDNFERAEKAAIDADDINAVKQGIDMISQSLKTILTNKGLNKIPTLHEEFNPDVHLAIAMEEDTEGKISSPMVSEEYQAGYKLNERVLRPASVKVVNPKKEA